MTRKFNISLIIVLVALCKLNLLITPSNALFIAPASSDPPHSQAALALGSAVAGHPRGIRHLSLGKDSFVSLSRHLFIR